MPPPTSSAALRLEARGKGEGARLCGANGTDETGGAEGEKVAMCVLSAFSEHVGVRLNKGTLACALAAGKRGDKPGSRARTPTICLSRSTCRKDREGRKAFR